MSLIKHINTQTLTFNETSFSIVRPICGITSLTLHSVLLKCNRIQLFRERLSNKTVRDNAERCYG